MIFSKQPHPQRPKFWTSVRVALTSGTLVLLLVSISSLSCSTKPDAGATNTNTADASKTNAGATVRTTTGTNAPSATTPLMTLPDSVRNTEIKALDNKPFRLSDYAGKVVVVDLWATWCGPCRVEIPHLNDLSKEYKDRGVEVIGLTIENPQTAAQAVRDFANEFQINYKIGWAERNLALALMNGHDRIPQTFVITRDGRVLKHFVGFTPQRTVPMLREAIEQAVKKSGV